MGRMLFLVYKIMGRMRGIYIMDITREKTSKRQTMRQSLKSTPPIIGDVASCIRPEDYLTMA